MDPSSVSDGNCCIVRVIASSVSVPLLSDMVHVLRTTRDFVDYSMVLYYILKFT